MSDLLPCPFCKSVDLFVERDDLTSAYVMCNSCGAHGPSECQKSGDEETPGESAARKTWNARHNQGTREEFERFIVHAGFTDWTRHGDGYLKPLVDRLWRAWPGVPAQRPANPVAWVIPGDDTASDGGWLDARVTEEGEFTRPLYAAPPPLAQGALKLGDMVQVNERAPFFSDWRGATMKVVSLRIDPEGKQWVSVIEGKPHHRGNGVYDGETTDFDAEYLSAFASTNEPAQQVPDGWKLVPIEPTDAMIEVGCENNPTQWNEGTDSGFAADVANDVYVSMVRASAFPSTEGK